MFEAKGPDMLKLKRRTSLPAAERDQVAHLGRSHPSGDHRWYRPPASGWPRSGRTWPEPHSAGGEDRHRDRFPSTGPPGGPHRALSDQRDRPTPDLPATAAAAALPHRWPRRRGPGSGSDNETPRTARTTPSAVGKLTVRSVTSSRVKASLRPRAQQPRRSMWLTWQALHKITRYRYAGPAGEPAGPACSNLRTQLPASQTLVMSGLPMFGAKIAVGYVTPLDEMPLTRSAVEYCGSPGP